MCYSAISKEVLCDKTRPNAFKDQHLHFRRLGSHVFRLLGHNRVPYMKYLPTVTSLLTKHCRLVFVRWYCSSPGNHWRSHDFSSFVSQNQSFWGETKKQKMSEKQSPAPPPYAGQQPGYPPPVQGQPQPPAYPQQGYAAQQPGYPVQGYAAQPAGYSAAHTTTIVQQPTIMVTSPMFRESPVGMACPYCHATIVTAISYEPGTLAWVACLGLVLVGCGLGCCFIPFCVDGCKDAIHTCPNCQRQLGVYRRM